MHIHSCYIHLYFVGERSVIFDHLPTSSKLGLTSFFFTIFRHCDLDNILFLIIGDLKSVLLAEKHNAICTSRENARSRNSNIRLDL